MSENWKIQVSPKLPDGTLVNIRAESGEELTTLLNYASSQAQLIADTTALLAGARNAAPLTQPQAQQQAAPAQPFQVPGQPAGVIQFPQQPAPAQPAAQGGSPACHHGAKIWRQAKPESGKSWKGWFCPSPQGTPDQCKPEFVK